jgi:hypothetical protein
LAVASCEPISNATSQKIHVAIVDREGLNPRLPSCSQIQEERVNAFFEISGLNIYMQVVVTLISIAVHLWLSHGRRQESTLEIITLYTIGLGGWFSISSGLFGHILFADEVARGIGWPTNSGFQMELAFAAIGIGLLGGIGFWNKSFWLPFIIAKTPLMWGAGITHLIHLIRYDNTSPSNTGVVLYWDFVFPVILISLYLLYLRQRRAAHSTAPPGIAAYEQERLLQ